MVAEHKERMVMTAVGPDRPGVVLEISSMIHRGGGNLEDSRMAVLAGEFALVVLLSGSSEVLRTIQQTSQEVARKLDFRVDFRPTKPKADSSAHIPYLLEISGVDQPGIVHRLSEVVAGRGVNVGSLESRLTPAAFSGTEIFSLRAELEVRDEAAVPDLLRQLERVCEANQLSLTFNRLEKTGPAR